MRYAFVLVALMTVAAFATGEFSTGGAELLKFSGYGIGRFNVYGEEDADPDMGFDALAHICWMPALNDWFDAKIDFKFKPTKYNDETVQVGETSFSTEDRNVVLFLETLQLNANLADGFTLSMGQFKRPFGYNYFRSGSSMYFADRSTVNGISGFGSFGKRDIGLNLCAEFDPVQVDVAFTNGAGENRAEDDSNKQLTARLQVMPVDWVTLGAAVGMHTEGTETDSTDKYSSTGLDFFAYGSAPLGETVDLCYEGEYMMVPLTMDPGEAEATDGTAMSFALAPRFALEGDFLTAVQPAVRMDMVNPAYTGDTDPENSWTVIDGCVNLHTGSKNTLQLGLRNYSFEDEETDGWTDMYLNWRMKF